jgi:putative mRNA 3-end processing factor
MEVVRRCNPEKVYTFHGFSEDFSKSLLKLGFDSESVAPSQGGKSLTLDSFL